jgi:two-component system nitrate/nitrite response regulator NarL
VSLRCLLADDHPALVVAIADFLEANGVEVVAVAPNGEEAVRLATEHEPDAALVDFRMPKLAGGELVKQLREASPSTTVVVYTAEADGHVADEVLRAGASGVVLKEAPLVDVLRALESTVSGRTYVDPALAAEALLRPKNGGVRLTDRERDVLVHLAEGLSHDEIGKRLGISGETVRTHVQKACERLGAATRTQAVATALRLGLIA